MFKRILVIVDHRSGWSAAPARGLDLARSTGAEVVFFSPLPNYPVPVADAPLAVPLSNEAFDRQARLLASSNLDAAVRQAEEVGVMSFASMGVGEDELNCVLDAARKRRCDLIVAGSDGHNAVVRLITGSLIPGLITRSPVPLFIVHDGPAAQAPPLQRLLVLVEDRDAAHAAVAQGVELARLLAAELLFVHLAPHEPAPMFDAGTVMPLPDDALAQALRERAQQVLSRALASAAAAGVAARALQLTDSASGHAVAAAAQHQGCDLIVVSHDGHNAVMRMITGSVLPGLVTAASVPVLVCRDAAAADGSPR